MLSNLRNISADGWAAGSAIGLSGLLYLTTLQTDINGADTPYTPDVGEIVNALNLGGILHQAGYPVFSMFGSIFVALVKLFGLNGAAAAGLWSWLWSVAAVGLAFALVLQLTKDRWVAGIAALTLAVSRSLWVNGSIAELQSFSLSLAALILLLALHAAEAGEEAPNWFHATAFVFSLAVSHGRALALLAPALAILLWRPYLTYIRRQPLAILLHLALAFIPWLTYLYLPLRVYMGAVWTFSEPTDWAGLRPYITADETRTNITVAATPAEWVERTRLHLEVLNAELLPGLVALGLLIAVTVPLLNRRPRLAAFLTLAWLPFLGAAYFAYVGFIWDAYLAVLMPVTLLGVLGLGLGVSWLADRKPVWGRIALGGLLAATLGSAIANYGYVAQLKTATRGRDVIETFKQALDLQGPGRTVLSATWGLDYFALAYGALVSNDLPGVTVIDQSAHYNELLAAGDRVYVLPQFFYVFGLDFWDNQLGRAYLTSAAPGIIQVGASPPFTLADVPEPDPHSIGDSITLLSHQTRFEPASQTLIVTLFWQAEGKPSRDYSVFVHLSDQSAIVTGADILAQSDSAVPVYGFYPTTRWSPGEIVREDYTVRLPDSRRPALLRIGLYTRTADGGFDNLGEANFAIPPP